MMLAIRIQPLGQASSFTHVINYTSTRAFVFCRLVPILIFVRNVFVFSGDKIRNYNPRLMSVSYQSAIKRLSFFKISLFKYAVKYFLRITCQSLKTNVQLEKTPGRSLCHFSHLNWPKLL